MNKDKTTRWIVPVDHPAFAGHFPGTPIVPGVLLLDMALHTIATATGITFETCTISSAKFLSAARPGDQIEIEHSITSNGMINFEIVSGARKIARGSIVQGLPVLAD